MLNKFNLQSKVGIVKSFDNKTCYGILFIDNDKIPFHSTQFDSGRPTRFPILNEKVNILYNDKNEILLIRSRGEYV